MKASDITYQDKLDELMLDIPHPKSRGKSFVFVEGQSDIKLFRKLFDSSRCKVEQIPGGKDKVEACVEQLLTLNLSRLIVGIRDADFIRLNAGEYCKTNMLLTDSHDIEMTILAQQSIAHALLSEYANLNAVEAAMFLNNLMNSMIKISCLKWLNDKDDLKLRFSGSGFKDLIDFTTFELDFMTYLQRVLAKSVDAKITDTRIIADKIDHLSALTPDLWQLTNGHDLLATLAK